MLGKFQEYYLCTQNSRFLARSFVFVKTVWCQSSHVLTNVVSLEMLAVNLHHVLAAGLKLVQSKVHNKEPESCCTFDKGFVQSSSSFIYP